MKVCTCEGEERVENLLVSHFEQPRMFQPQSVTNRSAEPASQSQSMSASQEPVTDWLRGLMAGMLNTPADSDQKAVS